MLGVERDVGLLFVLVSFVGLMLLMSLVPVKPLSRSVVLLCCSTRLFCLLWNV